MLKLRVTFDGLLSHLLTKKAIRQSRAEALEQRPVRQLRRGLRKWHDMLRRRKGFRVLIARTKHVFRLVNLRRWLKAWREESHAAVTKDREVLRRFTRRSALRLHLHCWRRFTAQHGNKRRAMEKALTHRHVTAKRAAVTVWRRWQTERMRSRALMYHVMGRWKSGSVLRCFQAWR